MKKTVLISGAAGQIGTALIKKYVNAGYHVVSLDLEKIDRESHYIVDITNEKEVEELLKSFEIDILINNAGIGVFSNFMDRTREEFHNVINVNMWGTFCLCRSALRQFLKKKTGTIINVASVYGVVSSDFRIYGESKRNNSEVYSMSKSGVIALTKHIATHFGHLGIRCNSVSPGGVYRKQTPEFVRNYELKVPLGRMASTEDVLSAVYFLSSEDASYINGQNLIVDGGFTSW